MEVHRQTCQSCGCRKMNNILLRKEGERPLVLVRCVECAGLVARYELLNYYHHEKSFESWLKHVDLAAESVIDLRETYFSLQEKAKKELDLALAELAARGKPL